MNQRSTYRRRASAAWPTRRGLPLGLFAVLVGMAGAATAAAEERPFSLTVVEGRLSLEAHEAPLQELLDEVSERSGIRIRLDEPDQTQEPVTLELTAVPLEEALRRLLREKSFVLVYSPAALAEARVYGRRRAPAQDPTPGPADIGARPEGEPNDGSSVAGLRTQALTSRDPAERARALEGLAANADQPAARDAVVEVLERESEPGLLQRALDIIGADRATPLEPLVKLAVTNTDPDVRLKALAQLVSHVGQDPRARQTLEARAADDPSPAVRQAARSFLQQASAR
jgi:HEAT repeats